MLFLGGLRAGKGAAGRFLRIELPGKQRIFFAHKVQVFRAKPAAGERLKVANHNSLCNHDHD